MTKPTQRKPLKPPVKTITTKDSLVIGIDTGEVTAAWSAVTFSDKGGARLVATAFFPPESTIRNLTAFPRMDNKAGRHVQQPALPGGVTRYRKFLNDTLFSWKPSALAFERFMSAGVNTKSAELVSFMNGVLSVECADKGIPFKALPAAEWKGAVNRAVGSKTGLKEIYAQCKDVGLKAHTVDSIGIALYSKYGNSFPLSTYLDLLRQATKFFDPPKRRTTKK